MRIKYKPVPRPAPRNPPTRFNIQVNVRVRPTQAGIADKDPEHRYLKESPKLLASFDDNKVIFANRYSGAITDIFKYPNLVFDDEADQQKVYDEMMPFFLSRFMFGYNVNFLCYGQTGSGKTHTAIGPRGTFSKTTISAEIQAEFGMFPRAALYIYEQAQKRGNVVTVSMCQDYFKQLTDVLSEKPVTINPNTSELYGLSEVIVDSAEKMLHIASIIEYKRITSATDMNETSSRSHFVIQLRMYQRNGDLVHINCLKFLDMAGSERPGKSGVGGAATLQTIYTNFSILQFTRVLEVISRMGTLTGGAPIPPGVPWKEVPITQIMKSSFDGSAFTSFILCVSQHEKNTSESWYTMRFGQAASRLKSNVSKPKAHNLERMMRDREREM